MNSIVTVSTPVTPVSNVIINDTEENEVFKRIFTLIPDWIDFDEKWNNGTGYFDHATRVELKPGEMRKCVCPKTHRAMVLLGTMFGTVVVFERFLFGQNGVYVSNIPHKLSLLRLIPSGRLDADNLKNILGVWWDNRHPGRTLNDRIESMAKIFADPKPKTLAQLAIEYGE